MLRLRYPNGSSVSTERLKASLLSGMLPTFVLGESSMAKNNQKKEKAKRNKENTRKFKPKLYISTSPKRRRPSVWPPCESFTAPPKRLFKLRVASLIIMGILNRSPQNLVFSYFRYKRNGYQGNPVRIRSCAATVILDFRSARAPAICILYLASTSETLLHDESWFSQSAIPLSAPFTPITISAVGRGEK